MKIKKASTTKTWATGAGHAAKTATFANLTGKLVEVGLQASSVTGDPDVTVTVTDADSVTLFTSGAQNDGTNYRFDSESHKGTPDADFNPSYFVNETLTVSIDPSADAGGSNQTLTVTVDLYIQVD